MYYAVVALLMLVLPGAAILYESVAMHTAVNAALVLKWYVFWAVGWRLLLAGGRQIVQPAYTAREILGHKGDESVLVVRELGFANVAIGVMALASFMVPSWRLAAALAGGIFYALAGVSHALHGRRNKLENVAMASDLFAAVVLLACVGAT